jgi:hypothetical protein
VAETCTGSTAACPPNGFALTTTPCSVSQSCANGVQSGGPSNCDGQGACLTPPTSNCQPGYVCVGNACATSCTAGGGQCSPGYTCIIGSGSGGICTQQAANGQPCSTGSGCTSNHCVSNGTSFVCCATACPDHAPCGTKDVCASDGSACQSYAGAPCCSGDSSSVGICDGVGAGTCTPTTVCAPYVCANAACGTSCLSNTDCAPSAACDLSAGSPGTCQ